MGEWSPHIPLGDPCDAHGVQGCWSIQVLGVGQNVMFTLCIYVSQLRVGRRCTAFVPHIPLVL